VPTESFLDATEKELLTIANACLKKAGSALSEPDSNFDQHTKLRLLLEAQSCLPSPGAAGTVLPRRGHLAQPILLGARSRRPHL